MFTDTHCHLAAPELCSQIQHVCSHAARAGVSGMVVPATQASDWQAVLSFRTHQMVRAVALGVHPWFADSYHDDLMDNLFNQLNENTDIWVGEIGLDKLIKIPMDRQIFVLEQQLDIAKQCHRPVILHNVRSSAMLLASLKRVNWQGKGIVHAFSGSIEEAKLFINMGFKIGIGSLLLNPNAKKVQKLAEQLPLSSILLETDSPYMLPNAVNMPANVAKIAEILAKMRQISLTDLATQLEINFQLYH